MKFSKTCSVTFGFFLLHFDSYDSCVDMSAIVLVLFWCSLAGPYFYFYFSFSFCLKF